MSGDLDSLQRTVAPLGLVGAFVVAVLAAAGWMPSAGAANSSVQVQIEVASHTQVSTAGCSNPAAVNFGPVIAGTTANPGVDCTISFGSGNDTSMLHAYQTDGLGSAMYRFTTGKLDQNWDASVAGNGQFTISGVPVYDWQYNRPAIAVQRTTGKFVAAYRRTNTNLNIVRFEDDGDLDPTFATGGRYVNSSFGWTTVGSVATDPAGNVYAATRVDATSNWAIIKLTPNGTLDTTFDGDSGTSDGVVQVDTLAGGTYVYDLQVLADGDLLLTGYDASGGYPLGAVMRLDSQGRRDTSFGGGDGYVNIDLGTHTYLNDALEQPDGKLVFGGFEWGWGDQDFLMARLLPNGAIDPTWVGPPPTGTGVFYVDGIAGQHETVNAIALLPDGDVLAVGGTGAGGGDVYSMRFNGADGTLDANWDGPSGSGNGKVRLTLTANADSADDVYVSETGEIFVAGTTSPGGSGMDPLLMKWRSDGTLDPSFDGDSGTANGAVRVTATNNDDEVYHLAGAVDGDLAMTSITDAGTDALRLIRFDGDGLVDYDDDNVAADNNWAEGTGFFGVCLRTFTGTSATAAWTTNATCPADDTSDHWRGVPLRGTASKVGQVGSGALDGSATFRFALRAPLAQTPGDYIAPITFDVIAPAV